MSAKRHENETDISSDIDSFDKATFSGDFISSKIFIFDVHQTVRIKK